MVTDKITIAMPVYERIDFFEEALNSALKQTISCPVYVIDNASSHNKFREIAEKHNNPLVTYIRNEKNIGMIGNWNRCIEACRTEYLSILHDDDVLHPNFIECCLKFLKEPPSQQCCFSVSTIVGKDHLVLFRQKERKERYKIFKKKYFLFGNLASFPGILFPVSVAKRIGSFSESKYPISDFDFWIRLSEYVPIYKSNLPYAFYRYSDQQCTHEAFLEMIEKAYLLRKSLFPNPSCVSYFFSMYSLYNTYIFYCEAYKKKINIALDINISDMSKLFNFFYKTNIGLFKYIYKYSYKIFRKLITL